VVNPRYAPDREVLPNGVIAETYGRAHAARQADAQALLDEISWADSARVLTVRCGCTKRTRLATVYRTVPPVIRIEPETHADPELVDIREQTQDLGVEYGRDTVLDILTAPDDRDLETRCWKCGRYELDRDDIVGAYERGEKDVIATRR
jgi:hypothetical protein